MTSSDQRAIVQSDYQKLEAAMELLLFSLNKLQPYEACRITTADEHEPYDALSDRFIRAAEMFIKFFRSYERLQFAEESDTLRDQLNRMEKLGIISSTETWFRLRDVRNRIVHDYLPGKIKEIYDDIMGPFGVELTESLKAIRIALQKN